MRYRHEAARKSIHLVLAVVPLLAWILMPGHPWSVRWALAAVAAVAVGLDVGRQRIPVLRRAIHARVGPLIRERESGRLLGSSLYLVSVAVCFWILPPSLALASLGFLIAGDTAAALIGRWLGRHRLASGKSLEGAVACLLACLVVGLVIRRLDPGVRPPVLAAGAAAATLAELFSPGARDNLVVPIVSGAVMRLISRLV